MKIIHPEIKLNDWLKNPYIGFTVVHPEDKEDVQKAIIKSVRVEKKLCHEYRVKHNDDYKWHALNAMPLK
ncbi:PAS domain-containing protein [Belliella sp. DSM 111904]|uniref:PAS domain-containing protein n=1 Tax=Belliella filtrata TaxID=2923435 RepID=A0ABS9UVR4_9BACT|nr:PAS domain-containing protein [Belliella filtrata]MCH7408133.1 PAS domain-containing protein [Belliella filtrata]